MTGFELVVGTSAMVEAGVSSEGVEVDSYRTVGSADGLCPFVKVEVPYSVAGSVTGVFDTVSFTSDVGLRSLVGRSSVACARNGPSSEVTSTVVA